eukprot:3068574-Amphidinium_carterae.4
MIAFNKWYQGKGKGQWNKDKGRGKDAGGKKGDHYNNPIVAGKDKGKQPVVCYTCGRPGHTSPQCYQNAKGKGNKGQSCQYNGKGQQQQQFYQQQPKQPTYKGKGASKRGGQVYHIHESIEYDYTQGWYPDVDYTQYQQATDEQQSQPSPLLGTPSHPQQSQMGMLHDVGAIIHNDRQSPSYFKTFGPWLHTTNEIQLDNTINTRYSSTSPATVIVGDIEEFSQQANIQRQLQQLVQPTKQEQEEHRITHLPYKSWCEQSVLQLDYAYITSNLPTKKKWQVHTILTGVETTTRL